MKRTLSLLVSGVLLLVVCLSCLAGCGATAGTSGTSYAAPENWAICTAETAKDVDLFILCPTVDLGKDGHRNMDLADAKAKESFVGALNMELGIYNQECDVYAPYYRQMTLSTYELEDNQAYLDIAYQDAKAAFLYYMKHYNQGRPFILAGFSQGAELGRMLMQDLFDDTAYSDKLVAAYLIGWRVTAEDLAGKPWIKMATGETDTGCVISFDAESPEITSSFVVPAGLKAFAINPLNWKTDSTPAPATLNKGACFTNYAGEIKQEIPQLTGAYLDDARGTLKVPDVTPEAYPPHLSVFSDGEYHLYDYQFFYRNLQENVTKRVAAYLAG